MHYKVKGAIKKNRTNFIIFGILWVFIAIVLVSPFSYSQYMAGVNGEFDLQIYNKSIRNVWKLI